MRKGNVGGGTEIWHTTSKMRKTRWCEAALRIDESGHPLYRFFYRATAFVIACLAAAAVAMGAAHVRPPVKKPPLPFKTTATVRRWMRPMTLQGEVAQLVFIPFNGFAPSSNSREYHKFVRLIEQAQVGGLILVNQANGRVTQKAEPYALAAFVNRLQAMARVPLMVSADFERGASMRVNDTTPFPHAMAFGAAGDPELARYEGEVAAHEARALGIQWLFYPVADVNNNPDNPVINTRSFGEDPGKVAALVKAFIAGAHADKSHYVLTTAKHFPGHGDTAIDTHLNLATVEANRDRLEQLELVPFRAAIEAGVDAVMTAHVSVPALAPPGLPATLAPEILTGLLRDELGFKGLIVTDALEMGSIVKTYGSGEAAVRALEAGADVLLMPSDPDAAIRGVVAAVESGRLKRLRIQESVVRILEAKERAGLDHRSSVSLDGISDAVNSPGANDKAQEVADRAVTLVRNAPGLVPIAAPDRACFLVLSEGRYSADGQVLAEELHKRLPRPALATLDPSMSREVVSEALSHLPECNSYVVAAYSVAYRGTVGMRGALPRTIEGLLVSGKPVTLIALGNPYLLRDFPGVAAYLATFSTAPSAEAAAVRALFGEIPIIGHLPVSIPGLAQLGDGLEVVSRRSLPENSNPQ
jgi:beta-N-acetylhexosaminidase